MTENTILYGLQDCYYSVLKDGTYSKPVAMKGAKSISLSPEGETSTTYADNGAYFVVSANNGYSGTLELLYVPESFYTDVLGFKKDANGNLLEVADSLGTPCALMFQFEGDVKARKHTVFKCTFSRPNVDSETREENIDPKSQSLEFKAVPVVNANGEPVVKISSTSVTTEAAYTAWYTTEPTLPTSASK